MHKKLQPSLQPLLQPLAKKGIFLVVLLFCLWWLFANKKAQKKPLFRRLYNYGRLAGLPYFMGFFGFSCTQLCQNYAHITFAGKIPQKNYDKITVNYAFSYLVLLFVMLIFACKLFIYW
jgi:hypothetical protein